MRFSLIDRIVELTPGKRITAVKALSLAEEYLDDHFPLFPVMPGVLMLESLTQAGAWLVRVSENFEHPVVLLKEARGVRYADFVEPGETLTVTAEVIDQTERETRLKATGTVDGEVAVAARLTLERFSLAQLQPHRAALDGYTRRKIRELYQLLDPNAAVAAAGA
jgi:3-hydroxyacyl-[acyl-carrier-protein] dehydratase